MIVVGSPLVADSVLGPRAAGLAVAVARAATAAGASAEVVGRVGEDPAGDAVLLDLAAAGIGHIAVLRDAGRPTESALLEADVDQPAFEEAVDGPEPVPATPNSRLDAADIELALRYVPDYRVVVITEPLAPDAVAAAVDAARWANAALAVIVPAGTTQPAGLPADATIFEAPGEDADGAFATMVGRYAAALDSGTAPADAFAGASSEVGWSRGSSD